MRTNKCDVCGRTEPEVRCRYSREKKFGWFRFDDDSQGGSEDDMAFVYSSVDCNVASKTNGIRFMRTMLEWIYKFYAK